MTSSSRTLVVLGGTGFFGKSFLDAFRRGLLVPWHIDRVIAVARRPATLRTEHPELVGPAVELVALDITTATDVPRGDYFVHAANTTDARRYAADPVTERATILAAAENFVRCVATRQPAARIVYASSGAVYGQQPPDLDGVDEDVPLARATGLVAYKRDYAEAKRAAEAAVADLGRSHGMRVAVARCFTFVGPYLPRDQHFAVGNFFADGLAGRPLKVTARHPVVRSYMHADDLVRWLMTIADAAAPACPVFNVGSDEGVGITDLARRVAARYGVAANISDQASEPIDRYVPSIARARRDLGLTLDLNLDRALDATATRLATDALVRAGDSATSRNRIALAS